MFAATTSGWTEATCSTYSPTVTGWSQYLQTTLSRWRHSGVRKIKAETNHPKRAPALIRRALTVSGGPGGEREPRRHHPDRKSTRLNSSHDQISYAVFCLKKKKKQSITHI